ncbi:MAG: helix-turn-helix transcriptional regulator [Cyanobacteria bacterium J06634_5]
MPVPMPVPIPVPMPVTETLSLQQLFSEIAQAANETALRQSVMAKLGHYFEANRWGLFFSDDFPNVDNNTPDNELSHNELSHNGPSENRLSENEPPNNNNSRLLKLALSLDYNPVLRYMTQRHSAVHDEIVLPPGVWQTLCPRADHGHVMAGPIIDTGKLVGGIGFTRHRDEAAFSADNLADVSALCLHISSRLHRLRKSDHAPKAALKSSLTPRENEIAALVAQGLTNKKIGTALWITENSVKQALKRMYRKLNVSSRAEMVAQLSLWQR